MFKKALQIATTFGFLLAGYAAYVEAFALVADVLARGRTEFHFKGAKSQSLTEREALELAVQKFGRGHWTADKELGYRYYLSERGLWMYAREYKRLNDGKQLEFRPFALIQKAGDGRPAKTVTSDVAVIDLDQPLGVVSKPDTGPMRVVHARIEGDVVLRDDKGTDDPADDLKIGPLTYVDYEEASLEVRSQSAVVIEDRDLRITGTGLLIKLRERDDIPATPPTPGLPMRRAVGFNGAQTAELEKNVHIVVGDVGPAGILPGTARGRDGTPTRMGDKTPLDLRCDGKMRIDLPKPRLPVKVGPPAPPGPTLAQFSRNVEVVRGAPGTRPDTLNCDHLRLVLYPDDKPAAGAAAKPAAAKGQAATKGQAVAKAAPARPSEGNGPLNDLTLRRAEATGHNVRITSSAQGFKARCNELIHKKQMPEAPDETYFRGDATTRLVVEKVDVAQDGPNRGKVTSFTTIRTIDATMFDDGAGGSTATIVARGPGEMESRPGMDRPIERTAKWSDQLTFQNDPKTRPNSPGGQRKLLTITGDPVLTDLASQSALSARNVLVVRLRPKPEAAAATAARTASTRGASAAGPAGAGQSFEIENLVALNGARLTSPGKVLTARDRLDAEFAPATGFTPAAAAAQPRGPYPAPPQQTAAAAPAAPAGAGTTATAATGNASPATPAKPSDPPATATANRVWARVLLQPESSGSPAPAASPAPGLAGGNALGSAGGRRAEIDRVYLRGAVAIHQDPGAGKARGTDVTGEAVDVINQGNGTSKFVVFHQAPAAETVRAPGSVRPAGLTTPAATPLARIDTDDMTIRGEVIALDQAIDQAWVEGRGTLTQMTARGLLSDKSPTPGAKPKAPAPAPARPAATGPKVPLTISWVTGMRFFGKSRDHHGRAVAHAEFYDDVRAEMEDSFLACRDVMRTYLDRTVSLTRAPRGSAGSGAPRSEGEAGVAGGAKPEAEEPRPDIALIECVKDVVIVNVKREPAADNAVWESERVEGDYVIYERATGKFRVPGTGVVRLYQRDTGDGPRGPAAAGAGAAGGANAPAGRDAAPKPRPIRPVANPARGTPVRGAGAGNGNAPRAAANVKAKVDADGRPVLPPLVCTQIKFTKDMLGRFGSGKEADRGETRWADFYGFVEVIRGQVPDADTVLNPDRPPAGYQFLTSQVLRVIAEPEAGRPDAPPRYLLRAWENAQAATDQKTISADIITFDSEKDLFWAYGEDGRDVLVAQQEHIGQGASNVQGRAAWYNHKTGEARLVDPKAFQFYDSRTGARPQPVKPPDPNMKPMKPKRMDFRNLRGNIERKDFNGR